MKKLFYLFIFLLPSFTNAQLTVGISTIAGTGTYAFSGDGGPATNANLAKPDAVTFDRQGNLYFFDMYNLRLRKVNASGIISTIAGTGVPGYSGDNGAATAARFEFATGVAVDGAGNVYIADYANQRIRVVNAAGIISTYAGNGTAGFSGDGGPATAAELWSPFGIAFDKSNNLFIADYYNYCIRKVTPSGIISTVAGTPSSSGNTGDGGPATAATFSAPRAVAVDNNGNLYIADGPVNRVRKVDASTGIISNFAGDASGTGGTFSGEGVPATDAIFYYPTGVAADDSGYVYISDVYNERIRVVTPSGIVKTLAGNGGTTPLGDGGAATAATLNNPMGVCVDTMGNVYVADYLNNRIRKITPIHCIPHAGTISTSSAFVSACDSIRFTASLPGGTWSVSGGHTTISSSGWVNYVSAGTDVVTYTVTDTCGVATVTASIASLSAATYDSMANLHLKKYYCLDSTYHLTDSITGGIWTVTGTAATIDSFTGLFHAVSIGPGIINYYLNNLCGVGGTTTKSLTVYVVKNCDSANYVPTLPVLNESNISIFPNPATGLLTIKMADNTWSSFVVTNNLGEVFYKKEVVNSFTDLDVSHLPAGMYFIRFVGNDGIEVRRFLKE